MLIHDKIYSMTLGVKLRVKSFKSNQTMIRKRLTTLTNF